MLSTKTFVSSSPTCLNDPMNKTPYIFPKLMIKLFKAKAIVLDEHVSELETKLLGLHALAVGVHLSPSTHSLLPDTLHPKPLTFQYPEIM